MVFSLCFPSVGNELLTTATWGTEAEISGQIDQRFASVVWQCSHSQNRSDSWACTPGYRIRLIALTWRFQSSFPLNKETDAREAFLFGQEIHWYCWNDFQDKFKISLTRACVRSYGLLEMCGFFFYGETKWREPNIPDKFQKLSSAPS